MIANRVGQRVHGPRAFGGLGVGMHPHLAKIMAEAWFQPSPGLSIERLARRVEHPMYVCLDRWCFWLMTSRLALDIETFLATIGAFTIQNQWVTTGALAL